ncbi:YihY/virulence factor BrkB family protein [Piscicoccus intestinalis]|uniref:YihY/virulence factor BrkB family protein n=1 Tax=Piscicoccus intestinalis TaxID=746033 RepID=UPI0008390D1B|nr:YihY/virulence factor BrkB family protein [Piscicoccus intestinalis]
MSLARRLDHFQRRHRVLGVPVAVFYKFLDDQGVYLSALIAFYGFFSIFPLFLLLASILGFVLDSDPELRDAILQTAMAQFPLIGNQIQARELTGSVTAVTIGGLTALYGSIAVASAVQNAMNVAWNVRRNQRPNPVVLRLRSIGVLGILGLFVVATTLLSQLGGALAFTVDLSAATQFLVLLGSFVLSIALFVAILRFGPVAPVSTRQVLPGAVLAAVLWQLLQAGGASVVQTVIGRAGATEGVFGIVLGLIMWLYIASMGLVACVELNVVLSRRLYPRALLTPMTDRVDLTIADQLAYTHLVQTQSLKGFQNVDVTFDHDGQNATAHRRAQKAGRSARGDRSGSGAR